MMDRRRSTLLIDFFLYTLSVAIEMERVNLITGFVGAVDRFPVVAIWGFQERAVRPISKTQKEDI